MPRPVIILQMRLNRFVNRWLPSALETYAKNLRVKLDNGNLMFCCSRATTTYDKGVYTSSCMQKQYRRHRYCCCCRSIVSPIWCVIRFELSTVWIKLGKNWGDRKRKSMREQLYYYFFFLSLSLFPRWQIRVASEEQRQSAAVERCKD